MRKILKWIGIVLGGIVGLIVLALVALLIYAQVTFKRTYADRPLYPITADTSPEGVARGEYLVRTVTGCGGCHAPGGEGVEPEDRNNGPLIGQSENINFGPIRGVFATPNLTPDAETGLGNWTDSEIARAIREGLDKDGVELVVMPSSVFHVLSESDVAAIVGYLRSLEPVNNEIPPLELNAFGKAAVALQLFGPRELGDPVTTRQEAPPAGTADHGGYLVSLAGCRFCHGENLAGGPVPFAEEGTPPAANLTPAGELAGWSEADFIETMRTGVTPSGHTLNDAMPWKQYAEMTDRDLSAIFKYLQTLPRAESE